jgi:IS5 family transposase
MKINYLKGFIGDEMNLLLAASAFNLKKWMNNFIQLIILLRLILLVTALEQQKQDDRQKYDKLFLLLFRLW